MSSNWTRTNLGSIAKFYSGGTPNKQTATYWGGTIPWISATSLKASRIFNSDLRITEEGLHAGSRLAKKDDVLLLVRGSALHQGIPMGIVSRDVAFNQDIKALRAQPGIDPNFLFYQLQGRRSDLLGMVEFTGIGAGKLDTNKLQTLPVELPDIEEQRRIAAIARSLDDRIDHNRALAANLEAIARRLFKSWFVDFDPVRAKAVGEKPAGLADDIAALFPGRFLDSELGEIPDGWACRKVSELCEAIFSGGTPHTQTPEYWGGNFPWLSSGETRSRFIVGTEKTITEAGVENSSTRRAQAGDVVIASAGQGSTRGQTSLLAIDTFINQSVVALRAATESYSSALLFLDLSSRYDEMRAISDSHSSLGFPQFHGHFYQAC